MFLEEYTFEECEEGIINIIEDDAYRPRKGYVTVQVLVSDYAAQKDRQMVQGRKSRVKIPRKSTVRVLTNKPR